MATLNRGLVDDYAPGDLLAADDLNALAEVAEVAALHRAAALDLAGDGTYTASAAEYDATVLVLTGTLTDDRDLVLPHAVPGRLWVVANRTAGAYDVTVQGAAGAGVTVPQGETWWVFTDGTDFEAVGGP